MGWKIGDKLKITRGVSPNLWYIRSQASLNIPAQTVYQNYRDLGMKGRKETVLDALRAFKYSQRNPSIYMPSDTSKQASEQFIPENPSRQRRTFRTVVEYTRFNRLSGQNETDHIEIGSNSVLSENDALNQASEILNEYGSEDVFDTLDISIAAITFSNNPVLK